TYAFTKWILGLFPVEAELFLDDHGEQAFAHDGAGLIGKLRTLLEFGFDREEARRMSIDSQSGQAFRNFLFERMIPNLKRVGLLTDSVKPKFEALGVLHYENAATDAEIDWASLERPLETGPIQQVAAE
ncbi:MAG: hypothetical protein ABIH17_10100, partial [Pseudomonadota bacterium]